MVLIHLHGSLNMGRHAQPKTHSARTIFLQALGGLIAILLIMLGIQLTWMFGGDRLDSTYQQQRIAVQAGANLPTVTSDAIAPRQAGDPPVDGELLHGQFVGWMHIPRLGADWKRVIQQGTDPDVLDNMGIGHYEHTPMPGATGNSGYAGHRTPSDLGYADRLNAGDAIIIETKTTWYVYKVTRQWVTVPQDTSVLDNTTSKRMLTLTTCDPMVNANSAPRRLIIRANFAYWAKTADGVPEELAGKDHTTIQRVQAKGAELVRRVSAHTPISPLLAGVCLLLWVILNGVTALIVKGRHGQWTRSGNVLTWLWRIQFGPTIVRVISFTFLWMAIVFASYAWLCPWLATVLPGSLSLGASATV